MDIPRLSTFKDIFIETAATWSNCRTHDISSWAVEFLFYMSMTLIIFYLYVIYIIAYRKLFKGQFKSSFYNCAFVLAIGDIGILLIYSRATIPTCALRIIPARYLAWESLGVFCVDLIYGINLVMAAIRLSAVFYQPTNRIRQHILNAFLALEFLWALSMAVLYFNGIMKRIWYEGTQYKYEWIPPFQYRTTVNMTQLGLTFAIYCVAFWRLRQLKSILSTKSSRQEHRLLILAGLIFLCELFFIYSSDWIGSQWGIGDDNFNAMVAYFGRPLSTGITPFFYLLFSSELRKCCFCCRRQGCAKKFPGSTQSNSLNHNNKRAIQLKEQVVQ